MYNLCLAQKIHHGISRRPDALLEIVQGQGHNLTVKIWRVGFRLTRTENKIKIGKSRQT